VAGFTSGVQMEIRQVPGMKNMLLGGEGIFNTVLIKGIAVAMPLYIWSI